LKRGLAFAGEPRHQQLFQHFQWSMGAAPVRREQPRPISNALDAFFQLIFSNNFIRGADLARDLLTPVNSFGLLPQ